MVLIWPCYLSQIPPPIFHASSMIPEALVWLWQSSEVDRCPERPLCDSNVFLSNFFVNFFLFFVHQGIEKNKYIIYRRKTEHDPALQCNPLFEKGWYSFSETISGARIVGLDSLEEHQVGNPEHFRWECTSPETLSTSNIRKSAKMRYLPQKNGQEDQSSMCLMQDSDLWGSSPQYLL